jgi:hypothetical protein
MVFDGASLFDELPGLKQGVCRQNIVTSRRRPLEHHLAFGCRYSGPGYHCVTPKSNSPQVAVDTIEPVPLASVAVASRPAADPSESIGNDYPGRHILPLATAVNACAIVTSKVLDQTQCISGLQGVPYGYVDMGGWIRGQARYVMTRYADFNLLKFPDRDQALAKICDLTITAGQ